jgi:diacylglycerol kinase family enzyme
VRGCMPFVFIGNNRYEVTGPRVGSRYRLDAGVLTVIYALNAPRAELLFSALKMLFTGDRNAGALEVKEAQEVEVQSPRPVLDVAADGEVFSLRPPLRYRICPGALKVVLPATEQAGV